ncbi:hypothetical protein B0H15DRAFT_803957 [Mycena belliarum]|uniref:Uncharacterized protein n=1 Tax=Mycena belliarum TaxID=1033014 RepID=A0AAD6U0P8_9AGAR|nr:hypothetical protein B0H15DRAFT_803957 [Mycena belliae]
MVPLEADETNSRLKRTQASPCLSLERRTDNTAALAAIFDRKPTAGQAHAERFRRYAKAFPDRDPGNTIDIDWSPGHEDIRGNLRKQQQRCGQGPEEVDRGMEEDAPVGQFITGQAFIGCQYGEPLQTRAHVLQDCAKHERHRGLVREVSEQLSIPDILSTEKGLQALAKFLENSGAFTKTCRPRGDPGHELMLEDDDGDDGEDGSDVGYVGDEEEEVNDLGQLGPGPNTRHTKVKGSVAGLED